MFYSTARQNGVSLCDENKVEENGRTEVSNAWREVGKSFGEAGKSFGKAAKDTAIEVFDDEDK